MSVDNMTELRKRIPGGKYALTRAIAERAKQLQNGALPLTEVKIPNPITVAIEEVLQGKVNFEFREGQAEPTLAETDTTGIGTVEVEASDTGVTESGEPEPLDLSAETSPSPEAAADLAPEPTPGNVFEPSPETEITETDTPETDPGENTSTNATETA